MLVVLLKIKTRCLLNPAVSRCSSSFARLYSTSELSSLFHMRPLRAKRSRLLPRRGRERWDHVRQRHVSFEIVNVCRISRGKKKEKHLTRHVLLSPPHLGICRKTLGTFSNNTDLEAQTRRDKGCRPVLDILGLITSLFPWNRTEMEGN